MADVFDGTHDALNRMKRAHKRGTGCYLTAEMIQSLSVTAIGHMWAEDDPRPRRTSADLKRDADYIGGEIQKMVKRILS